MKSKVLIVFILICAIALVSCTYKNKIRVASIEPKNYESNTVLSVKDMQEDLKYIKENIIDIHPNPYNSIDSNEFDKNWLEAYNSIKEPKTYNEFYFLVQQLLSLLKDNNTFMIYSSDDEIIPLDFQWNENGAWITEESGYLNVGDKILKIGDKSLQEILKDLDTLYPSSNEYIVRAKGNELLREKHVLEKLGLIDKNNRVKIEAISNKNDTKVCYIYLNGEKDEHNKDNNLIKSNIGNNDLINVHSKDNNLINVKNKNQNSMDFYSVNIYDNEDLAVFKLDKCENNDKYKNAVKDFFSEVQSKKISKVALDLRNNVGGDISVLDEFLKYTTVSKYNTYDLKVKKSKEAEQRGIEKENFIKNMFESNKIKIKHDKEDNLFNGKLFVLTSNDTINEGNEIAVIFKDNNIGKVIGERTGEAPSSYGDPIELVTPNLGIGVSVSTTELIRPKKNAEDDNTLRPYVYCEENIKDIISKEDSILDKIN